MKGNRFRFFMPNARILETREIENLPPEKLESSEEGREGVWIEIDCPDKQCIDSDGNITIPAKGKLPPEKRGVFLNLFCPENSCEVLQSTDLP